MTASELVRSVKELGDLMVVFERDASGEQRENELLRLANRIDSRLSDLRVYLRRQSVDGDQPSSLRGVAPQPPPATPGIGLPETYGRSGRPDGEAA